MKEKNNKEKQNNSVQSNDLNKNQYDEKSGMKKETNNNLTDNNSEKGERDQNEEKISDDGADTNNDSSVKCEETTKEEGEEKKEAKIEQEITEDIRDDKFMELQARFDELNDRYLRLFSEFDNFRKRMTKEKLELTKSASEDIIKSLLPVLDDMERAVDVNKDDEDKSSDKQGLELILNKFKSILRQKGVEEIKALGEDFNTDYHEAVTNISAEKSKDKGKIVEVIQKGYLLNNKVLRYAKVVVAN